MSWAQSLIKLATYEVEVLQKRLAEVGDRRAAAQMKLLMLDAEGQSEMAHVSAHPEAAWRLPSYLSALKMRKERAQADIDVLLMEEQGARDALAQAFEEQKKYEEIAEQQRLVAVKEAGRRESAAMDELGLRKAAGR
jgi:flagellar FliJ protein